MDPPGPVHARVGVESVEGRKGRRRRRRWWGRRTDSTVTVAAPQAQASAPGTGDAFHQIGDVEGSTRTPVVPLTSESDFPLASPSISPPQSFIQSRLRPIVTSEAATLPASSPCSPPRGSFTQTRLRPMQPSSDPLDQAQAAQTLRTFPMGLLPSSWGAFSRPGSRAASRSGSRAASRLSLAARGSQYAAPALAPGETEPPVEIYDMVQVGGVRSPQRPAAESHAESTNVR